MSGAKWASVYSYRRGAVVVGIRAQDSNVVHRCGWSRREGAVGTACARFVSSAGLVLVWPGDLHANAELRPCKQCYGLEGLQVLQRSLGWAARWVPQEMRDLLGLECEGAPVEEGDNGERGPVGRRAEVVGTRAGLEGGASDRGRAGSGGGDGLRSDSGEGDE